MSLPVKQPAMVTLKLSLLFSAAVFSFKKATRQTYSYLFKIKNDQDLGLIYSLLSLLCCLKTNLKKSGDGYSFLLYHCFSEANPTIGCVAMC